MALKHFGGKARSAVPALVDALADDDERVRGAAALTLNEIAPEVLTNALASP
jgi:HEAT repeat protein